MKGQQRILWALAAASLASCSGGGSAVPSTGAGAAPASVSCTGGCANATTFLTVADVEQVIAQAIAEAEARNTNATVGVVDRVGNVLSVYRMGAPATRTTLIGSASVSTGLNGIELPAPSGPLSGINIDQLAVIAKAITGAYLSSEGNAFSTRTAGQIVQQHFNPGTLGAPSGPLFGVQFSQLACSDLVNRNTAGAAPTVGPQRSPLGLSAAPGGFPLYKDGTVVGGVGVLADGEYGIDTAFADHSQNLDEAIAMAATYGYGVPANRRADQITVGCILLEYTNTEYSDLLSTPGTASFASLGSAGIPIPVTGYSDGQIHAGTAFGQPASGVRPEGGVNFPGQNAFVLVDAANQPRFPLRAGTDGASALTQNEVLQILRAALAVAEEARGQIRLPLGSSARVSITVVDSLGTPLGFVRSQDAPLFGADVALQKARTATLFSSSAAASFLEALPPAQYVRISTSGNGLASNGQVTLGGYISAAQSFLGDSTAFADGVIAYSDRAIANLSRPFFPDGIDGTPNGPFSKPLAQWSPFSTGLQLDLSINAILQHVIYAAGAGTPDVAPGCAGVGLSVSPTLALTPSTAPPRVANGLQIFPGSVPIYRGAKLVGAIGVSGDGVDQDDMVAFLGLENASAALNGSINEAPAARRADVLTPQGTRLLYVQCPQSPFLNSDQENVCEGF